MTAHGRVSIAANSDSAAHDSVRHKGFHTPSAAGAADDNEIARCRQQEQGVGCWNLCGRSAIYDGARAFALASPRQIATLLFHGTRRSRPIAATGTPQRRFAGRRDHSPERALDRRYLVTVWLRGPKREKDLGGAQSCYAEIQSGGS